MQLKKVVLLSALVSTMAVGTVSSVLADNTTPTPTTAQSTGRLARVLALVDRRIEARLDELNRLVARVQNNAHLSAQDKSLLESADQAAIAGLTSLKAKVDADTTAAAVRTDVGQIAAFRVYEVLSPQNRELLAVSELQATASKVSGGLASVQTKVNELQAQGTNVTAIQTLLDDANSKIQTINGQLTSDEQQLAALTPGSTNAAATISQIRQDLHTIHSEFMTVRSDVAHMRETISSNKGSNPVPTATASPTPTATPAPTETPAPTATP